MVWIIKHELQTTLTFYERISPDHMSPALRLGARSLEPDVVSFGSLAGSGSGWERSLEPVLRSRRAARLWNAWLGTAQNRWQEACQGLGAAGVGGADAVHLKKRKMT